MNMTLKCLQASEWKRFEYYGANMLSKQLVEGENYRQLQSIYQIIFVNVCPQNEKRLINRYIMRDPYGEAESKEPLLHRIYIQLPMIDEIAKEKGRANMLSKQLVEGENYRQLQPIYQIIFVNACPQNEKRLINRYIMRDPYGEAESKEPLLHRIYIQLPMIDEIAKEKGMEAMNDFEQVCYLFKNNANHAILKTKERLVRKLMEKHEKFKDDEGLWSLAMSRQMAEWREKNNLLDSYDEGKQKGLEEGTKLGLEQGTKLGLEKGTQIGTTLGTVNLLTVLIKQKFAIDAREWLSTLSLSQLYELSNQLLTCNTWEELKQAIKD